MKTKLDVARKLVRLLYYYLLVAFFTTFALYLLKQGSLSFENYLIIAVVMSISWLMREKSGNNVILFFTHVAMIAGVIIIEDAVATGDDTCLTFFGQFLQDLEFSVPVSVFAVHHNKTADRAAVALFDFLIKLHKRKFMFTRKRRRFLQDRRSKAARHYNQICVHHVSLLIYTILIIHHLKRKNNQKGIDKS